MSKKANLSGFTLVELMIIIAILADLTVIALPAFLRSRNMAQNVRFINDLRMATAAFEMYAAENNRYPADVAPGIIPAGMSVYLNGMDFGGRPAIGGRWDWMYNQDSTVAQVGAVVTGLDDVRMSDVDQRIDNGVLTTGSFRKRGSNRYCFIIE